MNHNYISHALVIIRLMFAINVILKLFVTEPVKWMGTYISLLVISKGLIITRTFVCTYVRTCVGIYFICVYL